jgi:hypothetical protein
VTPSHRTFLIGVGCLEWCGFLVDPDFPITHKADGIPSLPAFGSDASFFFWSVRPLTFYYQLDKPAINQLRVAPALLNATRCDNLQTSFAGANKHDNLSPVWMSITSALSKP